MRKTQHHRKDFTIAALTVLAVAIAPAANAADKGCSNSYMVKALLPSKPLDR